MWADDVHGETDVITDRSPEAGDPFGTDIVRHYLQQIGRVPLLKAAEERDLCARIEAAQHALAAALLAEPETRHRMEELFDAVRSKRVRADELLQSREGRPLLPRDVARAGDLFAQLKRRGSAVQRVDTAAARRPQRLGQAMVGLRADHQIDGRRAADDLAALGLGDAAGDADQHLAA